MALKSRKSKILAYIKIKRDFIVAISALFIFLFIGTTYLKDVNPTVEDIPDYYELIKNPYEEYEKLIGKANVKKLVEKKQFIEMEYDENLVKKEKPKKRDNPFLRSF